MVNKICNYKRRLKVSLCMTGVIIGIGLCGCSNNSTNPENNSNISNEANVEVTEDVLITETPYCKLYYPAEWSEQIRIEEVQDGAAYYLNYYANIKDYDEQKLFSVFFNSDQGDVIGKVTCDGEVFNVSIESYKSENTENWTDEEKAQLASMQENVNFIIDCLMETDNFNSIY